MDITQILIGLNNKNLEPHIRGEIWNLREASRGAGNFHVHDL